VVYPLTTRGRQGPGPCWLPVHSQLAQAPEQYRKVVMENPPLLRVREPPATSNPNCVAKTPQLYPLGQIVFNFRKTDPCGSQQGPGCYESQYCVVPSQDMWQGGVSGAGDSTVTSDSVTARELSVPVEGEVGREEEGGRRVQGRSLREGQW